MFYSGQMLAKNGPLQTVWLAAHQDRKMKRQQALDTQIPATVDCILYNKQAGSVGLGASGAFLALRLSGQLLLGVVRVYKEQIIYLAEDAEDALVHLQSSTTASHHRQEEAGSQSISVTVAEANGVKAGKLAVGRAKAEAEGEPSSQPGTQVVPRDLEPQPSPQAPAKRGRLGSAVSDVDTLVAALGELEEEQALAGYGGVDGSEPKLADWANTTCGLGRQTSILFSPGAKMDRHGSVAGGVSPGAADTVAGTGTRGGSVWTEGRGASGRGGMAGSSRGQSGHLEAEQETFDYPGALFSLGEEEEALPDTQLLTQEGGSSAELPTTSEEENSRSFSEDGQEGDEHGQAGDKPDVPEEQSNGLEEKTPQKGRRRGRSSAAPESSQGPLPDELPHEEDVVMPAEESWGPGGGSGYNGGSDYTTGVEGQLAEDEGRAGETEICPLNETMLTTPVASAKNVKPYTPWSPKSPLVRLGVAAVKGRQSASVLDCTRAGGNTTLNTQTFKTWHDDRSALIHEQRAHLLVSAKAAVARCQGLPMPRLTGSVAKPGSRSQELDQRVFPLRNILLQAVLARHYTTSGAGLAVPSKAGGRAGVGRSSMVEEVTPHWMFLQIQPVLGIPLASSILQPLTGQGPFTRLTTAPDSPAKPKSRRSQSTGRKGAAPLLPRTLPQRAGYGRGWELTRALVPWLSARQELGGDEAQGPVGYGQMPALRALRAGLIAQRDALAVGSYPGATSLHDLMRVCGLQPVGCGLMAPRLERLWGECPPCLAASPHTTAGSLPSPAAAQTPGAAVLSRLARSAKAKAAAAVASIAISEAAAEEATGIAPRPGSKGASRQQPVGSVLTGTAACSTPGKEGEEEGGETGAKGGLTVRRGSDVVLTLRLDSDDLEEVAQPGREGDVEVTDMYDAGLMEDEEEEHLGAPEDVEGNHQEGDGGTMSTLLETQGGVTEAGDWDTATWGTAWTAATADTTSREASEGQPHQTHMAADGFTARTRALLLKLQALAQSTSQGEDEYGRMQKRSRLITDEGPLDASSQSELFSTPKPQTSKASIAVELELFSPLVTQAMGTTGMTGGSRLSQNRGVAASSVRITAARMFVDLLVMQNRGYVTLGQAAGGFTPLHATARPKLFQPAPEETPRKHQEVAPVVAALGTRAPVGKSPARKRP